MVRAILAFNGAALLGCAIFFSAFNFSELNSTIITALLLFLPFLDKSWRAQIFGIKTLKNSSFLTLAVIVVGYLVLLFLQPEKLMLVVSIIVLTALPEEWFFRYYFLQKLDTDGWHPWINNIVCSILFAALHVVTQGLVGLMAFFPSLMFGYVYQRGRNLLTIVFLHGISNLFYIMYLERFLYNI